MRPHPVRRKSQAKKNAPPGMRFPPGPAFQGGSDGGTRNRRRTQNRPGSLFVFPVLMALAAALGAPSALAAFDWFHPAEIIVIGGQNPAGDPATASPELLRANCVEAALEIHKSFPGRQGVIGMFWAPSGRVKFRESRAHQAALEQGLRAASQILGGPERLVFMAWAIDRDRLRKIRRDCGIQVGELGFLYWRWASTQSRDLAGLNVGLKLDHRLRNIPGDAVRRRYEELERENMVFLGLVSHEGHGIPGGDALLDAAGKRRVWEDFFSAATVGAWERVTFEYARLFGRYNSFVGCALDEPLMPLNQKGGLACSRALAAEYRRRFGVKMPEFPQNMEARRGEAFIRLVSLLRNPMNRFADRCRDALHQGCSGALYTTPLVSLEFPWSGYDPLRPSLDVLQCDPYAFFDHQLPQVALEAELYDDAWNTVRQVPVHILYPGRAVWKYWRNQHSWEKGETMSWARSFRRCTPLVDALTDDLLFRWLGRLRGVLVWPIARVTDDVEQRRLLAWVRQGNLLLLSNTLSYDRFLNPRKLSGDLLLGPYLARENTALRPVPGKTLAWEGGSAECPVTSALIPVRPRPGAPVQVLSRAGGIPLGIEIHCGKGRIFVAFGRTETVNYPPNVKIDPYLVWLARRALVAAGTPPALLKSAPGKMLFLNTDGEYFTVFNPSGKPIVLSCDPRAYGLPDHSRFRLAPLTGGPPQPAIRQTGRAAIRVDFPAGRRFGAFRIVLDEPRGQRANGAVKTAL